MAQEKSTGYGSYPFPTTLTYIHITQKDTKHQSFNSKPSTVREGTMATMSEVYIKGVYVLVQ